MSNRRTVPGSDDRDHGPIDQRNITFDVKQRRGSIGDRKPRWIFRLSKSHHRGADPVGPLELVFRLLYAENANGSARASPS